MIHVLAKLPKCFTIKYEYGRNVKKPNLSGTYVARGCRNGSVFHLKPKLHNIAEKSQWEIVAEKEQQIRTMQGA